MSWSLGEAQALAIKAARGAGYSWGLAEEAGFSVRWLCGRGLPGPQALAAMLATVDVQPMLRPDPAAPKWISGRGALCPLALGAALVDRQTVPGESCQFGPVQSPLLLVPFVAQLPFDGKFVLKWDGAGFAFDHGHIAIVGSPAALIAPRGVCTLQSGQLSAANTPTATTRVPLEAQPHIEQLLGFAARTYAPATDQSRLAGAGAGTTDND
ncbi:MAG TPA: DUF3726 domain-containing protein [Thermohalobaculum sp.]|nr:DUF3726 domain-containing protein [Thermohalobaculum sp.]